MSSKINTGKRSIPVRVITTRGHNQENEPISKPQKNPSTKDLSKAVLKQRNPSGSCNNGGEDAKKMGVSKVPSCPKILSEGTQTNGHKSCAKVRKTSGDAIPATKTKHPSGEKPPLVPRHRHPSAESTQHQKSQTRHQSGHMCKSKETVPASIYVGKSFSETKKLVSVLQQDLDTVKKELEDTTQRNQILVTNQEQQEVKLGEDQERISLLSDQVRRLQEKLVLSEKEFEVLGFDPVSKEKLQQTAIEKDSQRENAAAKALELKEQLLRITEKNKAIISAMEEIIQEG